MLLDEAKQHAISAYNRLGKSQVIDWEPCQPCPRCRLFCDGYKRVDGTCFVVCEACDAAERHNDGCPMLVALQAPVSITCDVHKLDVCPECDACTCKEPT